MINLDGLGRALIAVGVLIVLITWGVVKFIDWVNDGDSIRTSELLAPEIELIINDNVVDTVYVYRQP